MKTFGGEKPVCNFMSSVLLVFETLPLVLCNMIFFLFV